LLAYLSTFGLEGVLEEPFDKELSARQDTVLDASDAAEAMQGDVHEANAKVMAYEIEILAEDYPSLMPNLQIMTDASYAATFEGDHD